MTWVDCLESLAYLDTQPETGARVDYGLAQATAAIVATASRRRVQVRDFMPPWWRLPGATRRDPGRVAATLEQWAARYQAARTKRQR